MLPRSQDHCRTIATYVLFFANVAFLYALCLAILMIVKCCVIAMTWGKVHIVDMIAYQWVTDMFKNPVHQDTFHLLEMTMQCCGSYGALSYVEKGYTIPSSCCGVERDVFLCGARDSLEGCADIISTRLQVLAGVADATLFYALGVEALALISCLYLLRTSEKPQPELLYTVVPRINPDSDAPVEMDQMQLVTCQPGQAVYEPCELPV